MPRFRSRSTKIQPYCDNNVVDTLVFTKVNLDVFGKTNGSCQSHPEPVKFSSKILSRMDDPEEVFDFSLPPSGFIRHSVSLPICTLEPKPGRFPSSQSSVDISRLHAFQTNANERVIITRQESDSEEKSRVSRRDEIFVKCNVWGQLENTSNLKASADSLVDRRDDEKPLQNIEKLTHLKVKARKHSDQDKSMETLEWTTNPEKCYRCILNFKQERSFDRRTTLKPKKKPDNEHPIVVDDLEDFQLDSLSPEALIFSAVEDNLKDQLENIIMNYDIDLNTCYNSKNLTPLHFAAQLGFTQCVQVLLKHGANVNCLNSDNRSPVYMAFASQHYECAILLIEAGADIHQFTAQKLHEFETVKKLAQTYTPVSTEV